MRRIEPSQLSEPPKELFHRVRTGDKKGLSAWMSGPRFVLFCIAAGTLLALAFGPTRPSNNPRKNVFERVAGLVNGPLRELQPFHPRIAPSGEGEMILLDARREACIEAAAPVEKIAALPFPPDEQGKAIESAEGLHRAAGHFLKAVEVCRGPGTMKALQSDAMPMCILQCMRGWSALVGATEQLRQDAAWFAVHLEPVAPPKAAGEQAR